jgi:hypothetical protein
VPPFFFLKGQQAASCAQTLAAFLSLPGYKVVNVQPGSSFSGGAFYTIAGPSRNQHWAVRDADREGGRYTPSP